MAPPSVPAALDPVPDSTISRLVPKLDRSDSIRGGGSLSEPHHGDDRGHADEDAEGSERRAGSIGPALGDRHEPAFPSDSRVHARPRVDGDTPVPERHDARACSDAMSGSWVTITIVIPRSPLRRRSRRSTSWLVRVSRLPVGSSARSSAGSVTSARAIATRCCWPPDSSLGCGPRGRPSPTALRASAARATPLGAPTPR